MISPTISSTTSVTFGSIEVIEIPSRRRRRTRTKPQHCDVDDDENDEDTGATTTSTATSTVRPRYHLSMEEYESEQAMIRKQERQRRQSQRRRSTFPLRKSEQNEEEQQEGEDDCQDGKTLLRLSRRCPMAKFASSASTTIPVCPLRKPQRRTSQSMEDLQDAIEEVCTLLEPLSPVPACA